MKNKNAFKNGFNKIQIHKIFNKLKKVAKFMKNIFTKKIY